MPGLIDAHTHLMFATIPQQALLVSDIGFFNLAAGRGATDTLMRGFTSVRDLGGPVFGLKRAIDLGLVVGPRIWPSGASSRKPAVTVIFACRSICRQRPAISRTASASVLPQLPTVPTRFVCAHENSSHSAHPKSS